MGKTFAARPLGCGSKALRACARNDSEDWYRKSLNAEDLRPEFSGLKKV